MREVQKRQFQFGQVAIEAIWLDPKSRDDIPAVLKGLQHLYKEHREELFSLLERHIRPGTDRKVGRPGMDLWRILVLGVLKQGLGCDFDRLHDLANNHRTVRAMLAHGDFADGSRYEMQTLIDNVSLLTPELLSAVATQVKGLACALWCSTKALILRVSFLTLENEPRRMACWAMRPKQRSTWLIQEAQVGVQCKVYRDRRASHALTLGCLWVA